MEVAVDNKNGKEIDLRHTEREDQQYDFVCVCVCVCVCDRKSQRERSLFQRLEEAGT